MTRNDYVKLFKVFGVSILCALPIVIILDLLIESYVSTIVLTTIDVVIFIVAAIVGFVIYDNRQKRIQAKKEELQNKKSKANKNNQPGEK